MRFSARLNPSRLTVLGLSLVACCLLGPTPVSAGQVGPDVTVFLLSDTSNYGMAGGIRGYSVGTTSCNIGDAPLNWCDNNGGCGAGTTDEDHPVIAQNMYRLKSGRFDQIGASWLKHGFVSTNSTNAACGTCTQPPLGGNQLGVGCTDPYGSGLNGGRPLGPKSQVDPTTGVYPFPHAGGSGSQAAVWNQRVAVAQTDLDAGANPGARYFVEGHYIAPDDAAAGNGLNNASYREVTVNASTFNLSFSGTTVQRKSAIEVWATIDPGVEFFTIDLPTTPVQRFNVARRVTDLTGGVWHYEYAVHNLNSVRAANRLSIEFFGPTTFTNTGFHDVDAHSGEPYDTADWPPVTAAENISWQTPAFATPANANALRWATMYNFWFDATRPPEEIEDHRLGLFTAGSPSEMVFLVGTAPVQFQDGFEAP